MEHLSAEELARLVDEAPDAAEQVHLDVCGRCADELGAIASQTSQFANLCDPPVPESIRLRVERQLAAEGLLLPVDGWTMGWGRALAAGFVLFVLGGASGSLLTRGLSSEPPPSVAVVAPAPTETAAAEAVVNVAVPDVAPQPITVEDAAAELERAETEYLQAVSRYAELSESGEGLDPLNRLAALEGIMLTTEAALRQAPADPVINNYHLTALGQRDALMRELQLASDGQEWF